MAGPSDSEDLIAHWESIYRATRGEALPWYTAELDPDLAAALAAADLSAGRLLDLGCGTGSQSIQLAQRGFDVTGTDISETAVSAARNEAARAARIIPFFQDDIRHSLLQGPFDIIFDRGCFGVLSESDRAGFARTIHRLLKPGGRFYLKVFSDEETRPDGPHRFSPDQIVSLFSPHLALDALTETAFQGPLTPHPLALFASLRRP